MPSAPKLTVEHRAARLELVRDLNIKGELNWLRVFFSDESRLTLDGPHGMRAHWQDSRRPDRYHYTRRNEREA